MTTDITELAQSLKAAAEKATPGPWYVHDKPCEDGNYGIDTSDKEFLAEAVVWWGVVRQSIWREEDAKYIALANPANILALVEALASEKRICATWRKTAEANSEKLEKAQQQTTESENRVRKQNRHICELFDDNTALRQRIAELESRTVKLPDGWQFEECEIEGCENGAIFSVGTGSRNIHLCDKCAHEPQNSRLKKSPLSKRLPFKMSAGIKVEAE
ncbi:TPA: ead/Ea22-like family protein [Klebsiella quasipneumoniae subsp. similipneumoniae]|nr:ead/Ea22-like family protein [Klebsiella quasipneumoniae subsp. similipneumoniae]